MSFRIYLLLDSPEDRIPVNHKVKEYVEGIINQLLISNKIVTGNSWNYAIYIHFTSKSLYKEIDVLPLRTIKNENVKMSTVFMPVFLIKENEDIVEGYVKALILGSKIFWTNNSKKVREAMFEDLFKSLDVNYIHSFKYPAEFDDQKYEGDETVKYLNS